MEFNEMMKEIKDGNEYAFEQLYTMTYENAYILAKSILQDDDEVNEALNIAYMKIARDINKNCFIGNQFILYRYVKTIVSHTCIDQIRKEKRKEVCFSDCDVDSNVIVDNKSYKLMNLSDKEIIIQLINELPDNQKIALCLQVMKV